MFSKSLVDLKDIYPNATTSVKTSQSEELTILTLICSPILINLSSELIRSTVSKCNENSDIPFLLYQPISILAYADDLVLITRTRESLLEILDIVSSAAQCPP